ncbi:MAG: hypothetical protein V1792_22405 [Pseudomonadota bacterium]
MQHDPIARLSRIVVPGYPHHVTQRGVRSMNVFHEESCLEYVDIIVIFWRRLLRNADCTMARLLRIVR